MITLILTDCQDDFISGSMACKNSKEAIQNIREFIKNYAKEIDKILFVVDWHPFNHESFKQFGGKYPVHCVQYTPGACIDSKILKLVRSLNINYEVSQKGVVVEDCDESSAFNDIEYVKDFLGDKYYFDSIVSANVDSDFIVTGHDVSVMPIIYNMMREGITPKVFPKGIICKDKSSFNYFTEVNHLEEIL